MSPLVYSFKGCSSYIDVCMSIALVVHQRTVHDTDNLHFSADMPHRFSEGSCVAIRGLPAR